MTVREALTEACAGLKQAGIETANLDASLLLSKVLNTSRTMLLASAEEPLLHEMYITFNVLVERRQKGECTAYILGKKEFRGLEFLVNPSVLVPRPDTEILVETAAAIIAEQSAAGNEEQKGEKNKKAAADNLRVLDLCTGSGAAAVSLKHEMPDIEVWATDISLEALETAKKNAERLLPDNNIRILHGDLYSALLTDNPLSPIPHFSLIISNPPYIPSDMIKTLPAEVQKEPLIALNGGKSGLEIIKRIINGAPENLIPGGALAIEADPRQMKKIVVLLEKRGFSNIIIYKDLSGQERVITGKYNRK